MSVQSFRRIRYNSTLSLTRSKLETFLDRPYTSKTLWSLYLLWILRGDLKMELYGCREGDDPEVKPGPFEIGRQGCGSTIHQLGTKRKSRVESDTKYLHRRPKTLSNHNLERKEVTVNSVTIRWE